MAFAQAPELPATSGEAAAVLTGARDALGGEKRISAIKTIVASGHTRQIQGDNLVPIEFEISIELPTSTSAPTKSPRAKAVRTAAASMAMG